jgi:hypothetical protein
MEKIDTLLTKAVRRKSWPAWLHYTPLVVMNCSPKFFRNVHHVRHSWLNKRKIFSSPFQRSSMKKSIGKYNSSLDQLHWTRDEARQFSVALGNQMNYLLLDNADILSKQKNGNS